MRIKNKSKEEITNDLKQIEKTKRDVILAKLLFPFMSEMKSVYDAQTALNAVAGYVNYELAKKTAEVKVKDLQIDLSKEEESEIKSVMIRFLGQIENENAQDMVDLFERYGKTLAQYGASEYLKNPMSIIKQEDLIK